MKKVAVSILNKTGFGKFEKLKILGSGAANTIFSFSHNNKQYVIKINLTGDETFENEFSSIKFAHKAGFNQCPEVYSEGKFKGQNFLIQEYIKGKTLIEGKLTDQQILLMANFYRNLHSIKFTKYGLLPKPNKTNYSLKEVINYANKIIKQLTNGVISKKEESELKNLINLANRKLTLFDALFENETNFSFIHGDANPSNFIKTSDKIIGIDWVWASIKPPSKEIADFLNKTRLDKKQENLFLKNYGLINMEKVKAHLLRSYLGTAIWSLDRLTKISKKELARELFESKTKERTLYKRQIEQLKAFLNN